MPNISGIVKITSGRVLQRVVPEVSAPGWMKVTSGNYWGILKQGDNKKNDQKIFKFKGVYQKIEVT